jgi:hypothetical protein
MTAKKKAPRKRVRKVPPSLPHPQATDAGEEVRQAVAPIASSIETSWPNE